MGNCTSSGGGGSGGGNGGANQSQKIYTEILQQGLNSNIQGIRNKAKEGIGNYSFKGASPVSFGEAQQMQNSTMKSLTRGENTLIDGLLPDGKHVYFAGKTESEQIQKLLNKKKSKVDTTPGSLEGRTTSTYDRWYSANRRKFANYYNGSKGK